MASPKWTHYYYSVSLRVYYVRNCALILGDDGAIAKSRLEQMIGAVS